MSPPPDQQHLAPVGRAVLNHPRARARETAVLLDERSERRHRATDAEIVALRRDEREAHRAAKLRRDEVPQAPRRTGVVDCVGGQDEVEPVGWQRRGGRGRRGLLDGRRLGAPLRGEQRVEVRLPNGSGEASECVGCVLEPLPARRGARAQSPA